MGVIGSDSMPLGSGGSGQSWGLPERVCDRCSGPGSGTGVTADELGDVVGLLRGGDGLAVGDMNPPLLEQCLALVFVQSNHVWLS